jgi:pyruvate/2-oxoglutarate dehydrogenase complex dihydrolipoamide dehydrogenase (E3) component
MQSFDAIIIGAGQAGPPLAGRLTQSGMTVGYIERALFGGTCVNTGCTPTKAMIASAYAAHVARRSDEYGVRIGGSVSVDMKAVHSRRDAIVEHSRRGVESSLRQNARCTVFQGTAKFESRTTVRVGTELLEATKIFINVGGRAVVPDLPGIRDTPFLNNSSLLGLAELPQHLIIVGGSYIGVEFAQMYRRFGSEVTIIEKAPRLLSREDEDISAAILEILRGEGIVVRLNAECIQLARDGGGVSVYVDCKEGDSPSVGSHILLAVGRMPNTDDLGLDAAGVETDDRGFIRVDDSLRSNVEGIYALGDCNGRGAFTHTAYNDFEIVAANLLDGGTRRVSDRIPCYAVYMDPPLARIGMSEGQVRSSGKAALIATRPMTRVNRALEKGESLGFMKILVCAESQRILGAALLGVGCDEVVHQLLDTMYAGAPYTTIQHAVHIHPTVSELIPTMLGDLHPLS